MHGRVKVRTTAEQEALKKKERAKKVAAYKAGISTVFEKRKNKIYDDELMMITERMLLQNPDIYTLWNIRREVFTDSNWNESDLKERYQNELILTENCLKKNPKSYYIWYQRMWVMNRFEDCDWKKEVMLCTKCLNLDERNFHCWNYREFVVQKAGISPEEELEFTSAKILNNFSNYSSWHYRSRLLTKIFSNRDQQDIYSEKRKELEWIIHAIFTDPNDSSAWFYQRWLLDTHEFSSILTQALIKDNNVILLVNKNVTIESIHIAVNNEDKSVEWKSWQKAKFSKLWFGKFTNELNEISDVQIKIEETCYPLHWFNQSWIYKKREYESCFDKPRLSDQFLKHKQLLEMEPNNKWAHLTAILLMRKMDIVAFYEDILTNLDILVNIDPFRSNYYKDLRSKYIIEYKLCEIWKLENDQEIKLEIDLSGLNLITISNNEYLSFFEEVNLGANSLSNSLHQLYILQSCKKLSLSSNQLKSLTYFPTLENLEVLSLRNNELNNCDEILQLLTRHKLKSLDLRENPICNMEGLQTNITQISPNLQLYIN